MVGNDIVDLTDPEARTGGLHPDFDRRVFACAERETLRSSGAPNRLRWMLWAAKEAAYKVVKKLDPRVVFSPSRFMVRLDETLCGDVTHDGRRVSVALQGESEWVHAIATDDESTRPRILSGIAVTVAPQDASNAVRALAIRALAERLETAPEDLSITRRNRVPSVQVRGAPAPLDLSLSHHGRLIGFACDLGRFPH
jgi:phosphopantetheinyl transferase (holo-ACP synthase)